ncbi:MAG: nucleotide exchange factor GrpE [Treponemataceae bacterium]
MEEKKVDEEKITEENGAKKEKATTEAECAEKNDAASTECSSCEDQLADALAKAKEFQDLYLRKAADFENYRKRMIREKQESIDYANGRLISDLLPIMDNFDRALSSELEEKKESIDAFVEGVNMIKGQLEGMLNRNYGLEYYKSKGETFDPNIHEAVAKAPSKDVKVQTVGEEIQKGYKLKDKVLRHAKVLVLMPEDENKDEAQAKN